MSFINSVLTAHNGETRNLSNCNVLSHTLKLTSPPPKMKMITIQTMERHLVMFIIYYYMFVLCSYRSVTPTGTWYCLLSDWTDDETFHWHISLLMVWQVSVLVFQVLHVHLRALYCQIYNKHWFYILEYHIIEIRNISN